MWTLLAEEGADNLSFIANLVGSAGVGTALLVAFLYATHRILTQTFPKMLENREGDISWLRVEFRSQRDQFLEAMRCQRQDDLAVMERSESRWSNAIERSEARWNAALLRLEERTEKALQSISDRAEKAIGLIVERNQESSTQVVLQLEQVERAVREQRGEG